MLINYNFGTRKTDEENAVTKFGWRYFMLIQKSDLKKEKNERIRQIKEYFRYNCSLLPSSGMPRFSLRRDPDTTLEGKGRFQ